MAPEATRQSEALILGKCDLDGDSPKKRSLQKRELKGGTPNNPKKLLNECGRVFVTVSKEQKLLNESEFLGLK